jgi:hypothetical protein
MMETIGPKACSVDAVKLACWFDRVNEPWNPITAAERQLNALAEDREAPPDLAAYDHLHEMTTQAVRWLDLNSCPDEQIGKRFRSQLVAYRTVAATARLTFSAEGEAVVAQSVDLRKLIDQQADAMGL